MAKKTKVEELKTEKIDEEPEEEATVKTGKEVKVLLEDGTIRVYSEKENGKDYAKLAESLVSKKPDKREIVK